MKNEIEQLVNAIKELIKDDMATLFQHAEDTEYIKGALRDSALGEEAVKLWITAMSKTIEGIEHEENQGTMSLSESDEKWLTLSKNLLDELKIDHKMEERI